MKVNIGDKFIVVKNVVRQLRHYIPIGNEVTIVRINMDGFEVKGLGKNGMTMIQQSVFPEHLKIKSMKVTKNDVLNTANSLLKANNTVTNLEIKVELRKNHSVTQKEVSDFMIELTKDGHFTYNDNGTYRIYSNIKQNNKVMTQPRQANGRFASLTSTPSTKANRISRLKALELMQNSKGHFFTVEFIKKKDNTLRKLNGQYVKDQKLSNLGYVLVKESSKLKAKDKEPIRNVNLQTLQTLKIGGVLYTVK